MVSEKSHRSGRSLPQQTGKDPQNSAPVEVQLLPVAASFGYLKSLSALPQIPAILVVCGGMAPECQRTNPLSRESAARKVVLEEGLSLSNMR